MSFGPCWPTLSDDLGRMGTDFWVAHSPARPNKAAIGNLRALIWVSDLAMSARFDRYAAHVWEMSSNSGQVRQTPGNSGKLCAMSAKLGQARTISADVALRKCPEAAALYVLGDLFGAASSARHSRTEFGRCWVKPGRVPPDLGGLGHVMAGSNQPRAALAPYNLDATDNMAVLGGFLQGRGGCVLCSRRPAQSGQLRPGPILAQVGRRWPKLGREVGSAGFGVCVPRGRRGGGWPDGLAHRRVRRAHRELVSAAEFNARCAGRLGRLASKAASTTPHRPVASPPAHVPRPLAPHRRRRRRSRRPTMR